MLQEMATSCERTAELLDRLQNGTRRGGGVLQTVSTWKDGIRDSMQSRNLKDEVFISRGLWRKKKNVFGLRKTLYSQENSFN
jgi:hypothetical protein